MRRAFLASIQILLLGPLWAVIALAAADVSVHFNLDPDVNVLIVGSEHDTGDSYYIDGNSQAFSPSGIRAELENILTGAGLMGSVNVVLEERYNAQSWRQCFNLVSWFYWPYPAGVKETSRWPNLRSEAGTQWDYIVLIGDPYTIEYMPGLYTHGVAHVAEMVAKGNHSAEVVLLMPWPSAGSDSSVDHYKEVVYRTGRSGGFKVAPAALAWQAAGAPTGTSHPSSDGAYIAAASIYSRIWGSATSSSYVYNNKVGLAETVDNTVKSNKGAPQYAGKFDFQSPIRMFSLKGGGAQPRKAPGGTSTEDSFVKETENAIARTGGTPGISEILTIGRDTLDPNGGKDYRRGTISFGYVYHHEGNNADENLANIVAEEMELADRMRSESDGFRIIPRRVLLAGILHYAPDLRIVRGGHVTGPQAKAVATYIYTTFSGRCPVDPEPSTVTVDWISEKIGYETAWRFATCQVRAPGFKAVPSNYNVIADGTDQIFIQFLNPPMTNVVVSISSSNTSVATVSPQTMLFNPTNYNVAQPVLVSALPAIVPGDMVDILLRTSSDDEVYHDLEEEWRYGINLRPVAQTQSVVVFNGDPNPTYIVLWGIDHDSSDALTYNITQQPAMGAATMLRGNQGYALYTPDPHYLGSDSFTFNVNDGAHDSAAEIIVITVAEFAFYGGNILENPSAELGPLVDHGWVAVGNNKWQNAQPNHDGNFSFFPGRDRQPAELYQDVNVSAWSTRMNEISQSFKFSGFVSEEKQDGMRIIVECRDASSQILSMWDSGDGNSNLSWKEVGTIFTAPVNTSIIRVRLESSRKAAGKFHGYFDNLSLTAIDPALARINQYKRNP